MLIDYSGNRLLLITSQYERNARDHCTAYAMSYIVEQKVDKKIEKSIYSDIVHFCWLMCLFFFWHTTVCLLSTHVGPAAKTQRQIYWNFCVSLPGYGRSLICCCSGRWVLFSLHKKKRYKNTYIFAWVPCAFSSWLRIFPVWTHTKRKHDSSRGYSVVCVWLNEVIWRKKVLQQIRHSDIQ